MRAEGRGTVDHRASAFVLNIGVVTQEENRDEGTFWRHRSAQIVMLHRTQG
jgi:hypothetical protein